MKYLFLASCIILACNAVSVSESTTLSALVSERPQSPDFCEAQFPFCPGQTSFPAWEQSDEIDVYMLQAVLTLPKKKQSAVLDFEVRFSYSLFGSSSLET